MIATLKQPARTIVATWPFMPESIPPSSIPHLNAFARRRARMDIMTAGRRLSVEKVSAYDARAGQHPADQEPQHTIMCAASDGRAVIVRLPRRVIDTLLFSVDPGLALPLAEPALSLVLECGLADVLHAIEKMTRTALTIVPAGTATIGAAVRPVLTVRCRFGEDAFDAAVAPETDSPAALDALLATAAALVAAVPKAPRNDAGIKPLCVPVSFEAGRLAFSLGALRRLALRDTLLPDVFPFTEGTVEVRLGGRGRTEATLDGRRIKLASRPILSTNSQETAMPEHANANPRPSDEADLDAIEVELVFELGRQVLEVAELRSLDAGYVFDLKTDPKQGVAIMAHGRRIGRGEIVGVGDGLGVRIVRLFGSETAAATVTAFSPKAQ
jgi:type III secretion protein Q